MAITPVEIPEGLTIYQGADWLQILQLTNVDGTPYDLTGKTAKFQARENKSDTTPFINLTTENGGITISEVNGLITLQMAYSTTAALDIYAGFFDLFIYTGTSTSDCLCFGNLIVVQKVTA